MDDLVEAEHLGCFLSATERLRPLERIPRSTRPIAEMRTHAGITKVRHFSFEMPLTVFYRLFPIVLKPSPALLFALFDSGTAADLA